MRIGDREFIFGRKTYVMGILNVTPDSFSDGGDYEDIASAVRKAEKMISEGADLIDVGGESSRPGCAPVSASEELRRIQPVIVELKKRFDIPVSVDTCKSKVALAALDAGADMLNDIWGFRRDEEMAALAAERGVPVCLMHNRDREYRDFLPDMLADLRESLAVAKRHGVREENIILDPGIGFGKTYEQNLTVMRHLDRIVELGHPVLLGVSRKSVIGETLKLPVTEREEGTIAANVIGAVMGCAFVRVHDVEKNVRALRMADVILHEQED